MWFLMLYWTFLENVLYAERDQKVGKRVVLQDLQETVQKARQVPPPEGQGYPQWRFHENLSNTWAKP